MVRRNVDLVRKLGLRTDVEEDVVAIPGRRNVQPMGVEIGRIVAAHPGGHAETGRRARQAAGIGRIGLVHQLHAQRIAGMDLDHRTRLAASVGAQLDRILAIGLGIRRIGIVDRELPANEVEAGGDDRAVTGERSLRVADRRPARHRRQVRWWHGTLQRQGRRRFERMNGRCRIGWKSRAAAGERHHDGQQASPLHRHLHDYESRSDTRGDFLSTATSCPQVTAKSRLSGGEKNRPLDRLLLAILSHSGRRFARFGCIALAAARSGRLSRRRSDASCD